MDSNAHYSRLERHIAEVKKRMEVDELRFNSLKESLSLNNEKIKVLIKPSSFHKVGRKTSIV